MKLSHQDAKLYFELMWKLQFFAKEQLQMLPDVTTIEDYANSPAEEKLPVRKALFEERTIIDTFVTVNPYKLPRENLEIVQSWKDALVGDFYVERMLKRYTIFVGADDDVYGVLGLYDDFDEMFHKSRLPVLVKTILLPFQGQIIYDGLMQGSNMYFGGGIKGNLKEAYLTAKQNNRIIERLGDTPAASNQPKSSKQSKDWSAEFEQLAAQAKKLRSGSTQPAVNSPSFGLIKASIEFGQLATSASQDVDELWKQYKKLERSMRKLGDVLYRMD